MSSTSILHLQNEANTNRDESKLGPLSTYVNVAHILNFQVLDQIFGYLGNDDLDRCALVRRYWFEHIHTMKGFDIKIGAASKSSNRQFLGFGTLQRPALSKFIKREPDDANQPHLKLVRLSYIEEFGAKSVWLTGRPAHGHSETAKFRFWYLVKKLIIDGFLTLGALCNLIQPLRNLRELTIGQGTLLQLDLEDTPSEWSFPRLTTFVISGKQLTVNTSQFKEHRKLMENYKIWRQMILNIRSLLKNVDFPSLTEFVLQDLKIGTTKQEDIIIGPLVQFMTRHKSSLRKISIGIAEAQGVLQFNSQLSTPINYGELGTQLRGLKLESFFVHNTRKGAKTRRTQQLLSFALHSQNSLKHVVWIFSPEEILLLDPTAHLIPNNCNSLESIEMAISPKVDNLKCQVFARCTGLKSLALVSGKRTWRNEQGNLISLPTKARVTQLSLLPFRTLRTLRICNFEISADETECLGQDNVCLDLLELQETGRLNGLGLRWSTLGAMLDKALVQFICLKLALNNDDPSSIKATQRLAVGFETLWRAQNDLGALLLKLVNGKYELHVEGHVFGVKEVSYTFSNPRWAYHKNHGLKIPYGSTVPGFNGNDFSTEYTNVILSEHELSEYLLRAMEGPAWVSVEDADEEDRIEYEDPESDDDAAAASDTESEDSDDNDSGLGYDEPDQDELMDTDMQLSDSDDEGVEADDEDDANTLMDQF